MQGSKEKTLLQNQIPQIRDLAFHLIFHRFSPFKLLLLIFIFLFFLFYLFIYLFFGGGGGGCSLIQGTTPKIFRCVFVLLNRILLNLRVFASQNPELSKVLTVSTAIIAATTLSDTNRNNDDRNVLFYVLFFKP